MTEDKAVNRRTLIDSFVFIAISLMCLWEAYRLYTTADPNALSQRLIPGSYVFILGAILLIAGLVHLARHLRAAEEPVARTSGATRLGIASIVGALAGYAVLMTFVGYFVSTFLFFIAIFRIFSVKPWLLNLAISLVLAGAFYLIFARYLSIIFPRGLLF